MRIFWRGDELLRHYTYNDNNLAIAYYRYSSAGQNEASIEQQQDAAHDYADEHGYTIIKEYEDKAITGTTDERPNYQLMLSEVNKLKPAIIILWKNDRLGRDRIELALSKDKLRKAGCAIRYVADYIPDNPGAAIMVEGINDSMAEFYSYNLSENVKRGLKNLAKHCLYGQHILGYKKSEDKHYEIDSEKAPVVERIFKEYADGRTMTAIINDLTNEGIRSRLDKPFTVNSLRAILKNRAYIGEYHYGEVVKPGGMPAIVSEELFEQCQKRFALNKRKGAQLARGLDGEEPRYWLTGRLFCGECGESMHGLSGTSKTGKIHYYYECKNHRKKNVKCPKKNVSKLFIENLVVDVLKDVLSDSENLASLAVDVANYYKKLHSSDGDYLKSLKAQLRDTEKALKNLVKAIEMGIFSETTQARLLELEEQKKSLTETIDKEEIKQNILQDDYSIKHYFELYSKTNFEDSEVRDAVFEYFIDKIYVYDDKLLITLWYSDDKHEVPFCDISTTMTEFECSALPPALVRSDELYSYFVIKSLLAICYRMKNS